jgi:EAL domain-containing protein (putative c-di-GMP-specific phosphodiesterase class I)
VLLSLLRVTRLGCGQTFETQVSLAGNVALMRGRGDNICCSLSEDNNVVVGSVFFHEGAERVELVVAAGRWYLRRLCLQIKRRLDHAEHFFD